MSDWKAVAMQYHLIVDPASCNGSFPAALLAAVTEC